MGDIVTFIKYVDFHVTCAKNAVNYNYTKPIIMCVPHKQWPNLEMNCVCGGKYKSIGWRII